MKAKTKKSRALLASITIVICILFASNAQANVTTDQISTALQQTSFIERVKAFANLVPKAQGQSIPSEVQNLFGTALVQIFSQRAGQPAEELTAFKDLLSSASVSPLLNSAQQEYVKENMIPQIAAAAAAQAKTQQAKTMQSTTKLTTVVPTQTANSSIINTTTIQAVRGQPNTVAKIQALYTLMQQGEHQKHNSDVQSAFATVLVETFNEAKTTQTYIFQLLNAATQSPLLNQQQQQYVANEMIPALEVDAPEVATPTTPAVSTYVATTTTQTTNTNVAQQVPIVPVSTGVPTANTQAKNIPLATGTTYTAISTPIETTEAIPLETTTKKNNKKRIAKLKKRLKKYKKQLKKAKGNKKKKLRRKIKRLRKKIKRLSKEKSKKNSKKKNKKKSKKKSKKKKSKKKKSKKKKKKKSKNRKKKSKKSKKTK